MARQATKACGNRYFEARIRAARYNEKLLTRAGAVDVLPGVTEDSLKKYELDINRPPNTVVALMADAYNDGYWASVLWQRHNLRMEEFHAMPRRLKLLYIASELEEDRNPVRHDTAKRG